MKVFSVIRPGALTLALSRTTGRGDRINHFASHAGMTSPYGPLPAAFLPRRLAT